MKSDVKLTDSTIHLEGDSLSLYMGDCTIPIPLKLKDGKGNVWLETTSQLLKLNANKTFTSGVDAGKRLVAGQVVASEEVTCAGPVKSLATISARKDVLIGEATYPASLIGLAGGQEEQKVVSVLSEINLLRSLVNILIVKLNTAESDIAALKKKLPK